MKEKRKKRILASLLCAVLCLNSGVSAFADNLEAAKVQEAAEGESSGELLEFPKTQKTLGLPEFPKTAEFPETTETENAGETQKDRESSEAGETGEAAKAGSAEENGETEGAGIAGGAESPKTTDSQAQDRVWEQEVHGMALKVTAPRGVLPKDARLETEEITDEERLWEIETAAEKKAAQEGFSVKQLTAYAITFSAEGREIKPEGEVQVTAEPLEQETEEKTEDETVFLPLEDKGLLEYAVVQKGDADVHVQIRHYNEETKEEIYRADEGTLLAGEKVSSAAKAVNWEVSRAEVTGAGISKAGERTSQLTKEEYSALQAVRDTTVKVYYTPKEETVTGNVTFYDYTKYIKPAGNSDGVRSINMPSCYDKEITGGSDEARITVGGSAKPTDTPYQSSYQENGKSLNIWDNNTSSQLFKGMVKGLDEEGNVQFNYRQPGLFENSDIWDWKAYNYRIRYLRQVHYDYTLQFSREGNAYTLQQVKNSSGKTTATAGDAQFLPLKEENGSDKYFFGMRYDVNFQIGDYTGPLAYNFTGADEAWVILDGKQVVLDLGGLHDTQTQAVDLWQYINGGAGADALSEGEKDEIHTLTVLYLERDGRDSACQMAFTLPNAEILPVQEPDRGALTLKTVDINGQPLAGAEFTLTNQFTNEKQTAESFVNGEIVFSELKEGIYLLEETRVPEGYAPTIKRFSVQVTRNREGKATAALYMENKETPYENPVPDPDAAYYSILHLNRQNQVESVLESTKTAQVVDWDRRTYHIDITAQSNLKGEITLEETKPVDVALVLDTSGSMQYPADAKESKIVEVVGPYKEVRHKLDKTKVYRYGDANGIPAAQYEQFQMIYADDMWQYRNTSGFWNPVPEEDDTVISYIKCRGTALKEAANAFLRSMEEKSPESQVSVIGFSDSSNNNVHAHGKVYYELGTIEGKANEVIKQVSGLPMSGETEPEIGFIRAREQFEQRGQGKEVPKNVIFFTDGQPYGNGGSLQLAQKAKAAAELLKQDGASIYTVGFDLTQEAGMEGGANKWNDWLDGTYNSYLLYEGEYVGGIATDKNHAFKADNAEGLQGIFKMLEQTFTQSIEIKGAEFKDVIDPRFVILDDEGTPITADYLGIEEGIRLENGGTVYYDKQTGQQYILWSRQTIGTKEKKWAKRIYVQAREDYIGGNDVPTNLSPDSVITTGYETIVLAQPKVNVKAELKVSDAEETIFLGDAVPVSEEAFRKLFDVSKYGKQEYGIEETDFIWEWFQDKECTKSITPEEIGKLSPSEDRSFYLKLTYCPGEPSKESTKNTDNKVCGTYHEADGKYYETAVNADHERDYGVYKIHIVSGKIRIQKEITEPGKHGLDGDPIFTFKIVSQPSGNGKSRTYYRTVRLQEGKKTAEAEVLENLPRGTYTVTELDTQKYDLKLIEALEGSCKAQVQEKESITFTLGTNAEGEKDIKATEGKARFQNERTGPNTNTDADVVVNRFTRNPDGTYSYEQIRNPGGEAEETEKTEETK